MANLGREYRNDEAPESEFEPLPAGDYMAQIIESDVGPTKANDGTILKLVYEIMTGPMANRRVFDRLNIVNPNATAQGIAQRALADTCAAIGLAAVSDSAELEFKPMMIRLGIREDKSGNYGPQNNITKRWPVNGGAAQQAQPQQQPNPSTARSTFNGGSAPSTPPAQQQRGGTRPWGNRATA